MTRVSPFLPLIGGGRTLLQPVYAGDVGSLSSVRDALASALNSAVGAAIAAMLMTFFVAQPYFEAKAFNKFKPAGAPEATYLDAVMSDLRINATPEDSGVGNH